MLDEGVCLLCGRPVGVNALYCSRECSNIDSSSSTSASASAASSAQHSPMIYPVDSGASAADPHPNSDIPALVHSHLRNRQSMSSNSTLDSDDYVYGANRRPSINYSRRPSATNQRSTLPSLLHRRTSSTTSEASYGRLAEQDPSFAIAKALNDIPLFSSRSAITTSSSSSSADFSSDEERIPQFRIQRGGVNQRTITSRHHNPLNNTRLTTTAATARANKKQHRASLPAYFSRLSVEATTSTGGGSVSSAASLRGEGAEPGSLSDHDTPIQPNGYAQSFPSPRSHPSSSSGCNTSATLGSGARAVETTPRGRGRDRRVRQGASRSPHARPRRSHSRSLSHSFSRSRSPSLSASPYQLRSTDGLVIGGAQAQPRTAPQVATSPISHRHSLGERANRPAALPATQPEEVEAEAAPRGRRARGEEDPAVEGEERERGRSRVVVVKRGKSVTAGAGVAVQ